MKIEAAHIENYAAGCFGGEVVEGAWYGRHIPEALTPLYQRTEHALVRMQCSTGVRLRFASDATRITVTLRFGVRAREIFTSTLLVDGVEQAVFGPAEFQPEWTGVIFEQEESVEHIFDLHLPNMVQCGVVSLEFEGESYAEPLAQPPLRWLVYGDSITQGMTSTAPHLCHVARCALALDADAFNLGVGGACLDKELAENVPDEHYDLVSVAYGSNDFNGSVTPGEFAANARALLNALREKTRSPILLITPLTWASLTEPNKAGNSLQEYRDALRELPAQFENVTLIHGDQMIPDDEKFFVDSVHPNDHGFSLYASQLLPFIESALEA